MLFTDPMVIWVVLGVALGALMSVIFGLILYMQHSMHMRLFRQVLDHQQTVLDSVLAERAVPTAMGVTRPDHPAWKEQRWG